MASRSMVTWWLPSVVEPSSTRSAYAARSRPFAARAGGFPHIEHREPGAGRDLLDLEHGQVAEQRAQLGVAVVARVERRAGVHDVLADGRELGPPVLLGARLDRREEQGGELLYLRSRRGGRRAWRCRLLRRLLRGGLRRCGPGRSLGGLGRVAPD